MRGQRLLNAAKLGVRDPCRPGCGAPGTPRGSAKPDPPGAITGVSLPPAAPFRLPPWGTLRARSRPQRDRSNWRVYAPRGFPVIPGPLGRRPRKGLSAQAQASAEAPPTPVGQSRRFSCRRPGASLQPPYLTAFPSRIWLCRVRASEAPPGFKGGVQIVNPSWVRNTGGTGDGSVIYKLPAPSSYLPVPVCPSIHPSPIVCQHSYFRTRIWIP